ncbi:hypothetical protein ACIQVE_26215, partial [Pseudomonas sp. NPDC098747]|uniref:hypothetical protein n=1 Tax=Pseudomonas sp. NPDC098747 TaxID=3364487 RepID=UPI00383A30EC
KYTANTQIKTLNQTNNQQQAPKKLIKYTQPLWWAKPRPAVTRSELRFKLQLPFPSPSSLLATSGFHDYHA